MNVVEMLLPLALILCLSKVLIKVCQRVHLPTVVGMLLSGLLIGGLNMLCKQFFFDAESGKGFLLVTGTAQSGLEFLAKIGVILIMFSAGLETDVRQIKAVGVPAVIITVGGVAAPMFLFFGLATLLNPDPNATLLQNLFYGVILTATSVSVTVATLKELGQLSTRLGSTIVSAAILDDLIGIVVLSLVLGLERGNTSDWWIVLVKTVAFFVAALLVGVLIRKLFRWLDGKFPHHRMIPVFSLAVCFFYAYFSETVFGVADITGAFVAGLILSKNPEMKYIDRRSDILSYMIFTPVFFASIGIKADFSGINLQWLLFGVVFILAGMAGKLIGCGGLALACRYSARDSVRIGLGMMARAEVALVCANKGVDGGMISPNIMPFIVLLIIITSFLTPVLLKLSYRGQTPPLSPEAERAMDEGNFN